MSEENREQQQKDSKRITPKASSIGDSFDKVDETKTKKKGNDKRT